MSRFARGMTTKIFNSRASHVKMDLDALKFAIALLSLVFAGGFCVGYLTRAVISLRHRISAQHDRMLMR